MVWRRRWIIVSIHKLMSRDSNWMNMCDGMDGWMVLKCTVGDYIHMSGKWNMGQNSIKRILW
jgi:hypothetical protein